MKATFIYETGKEEIKIISSNINETIKLNGMTVKTYVVNNKELDKQVKNIISEYVTMQEDSVEKLKTFL